MSTTSVVTGLVTNRFGNEAAKVTNEGLDAAGHAIGTAWAVFKISKEHGGIMRFIQVSSLGASSSSPSRMLRAKVAAEEALLRELPEIGKVYGSNEPISSYDGCKTKTIGRGYAKAISRRDEETETKTDVDVEDEHDEDSSDSNEDGDS